MTRVNEIELYSELEDIEWKSVVSEVYAWQPGHQWYIMWGKDPLIEGRKHYEPIEMIFRNLGTGEYVDEMVIEQATLNFTYPSVKTGVLIHGESLDVQDIITWFADAGINTELPHVLSDAEFVMKVIHGMTEGQIYRSTTDDPMKVFYHVPVGSHHPRHSIVVILIGIIIIFVLLFLGRRRIRNSFEVSDCGR